MARNQNDDLFLFKEKPKRGFYEFFKQYFLKDKSEKSFHEITWENSPKKVQLKISIID